MGEILRKISKKKAAIITTAMIAVSSVPCFAEETTSGAALGALPAGTSDMFSKLALGLVATVGVVAVAALAVYAAPQALVVAKKIFKKVSG